MTLGAQDGAPEEIKWSLEPLNLHLSVNVQAQKLEEKVALFLYN